MQHIVDKKRHATAIKAKQKMKFMEKGVKLEETFTHEVGGLKD